MTNKIKMMIENAQETAKKRVGKTTKCYVEIYDVPCNSIGHLNDYPYNGELDKELAKIDKFLAGYHPADELSQIVGTNSSAMMFEIWKQKTELAKNKLLEEFLKN